MFGKFVTQMEADMSDEEVDKCVKEWTETIVGGLVIFFCLWVVMTI